MNASEWYIIRASFDPPNHWYLAVHEKTEEQAMLAEVEWDYDYHFERGPNVAGSGYEGDESFSGVIGCVSFQGDMALEYAHYEEDARCTTVSQAAIDDVTAMGYMPRYC